MAKDLTSSFLQGYGGTKKTTPSSDTAKKPKKRKGQYSRPGSEDRLFADNTKKA